MNKKLTNYIIPPWDSRYGKLGHMWSKLTQYRDGSGRNLIYYFIPHELVINEYVTDKTEVTKSPTNWDRNNWVSSRIITRILLDCCKLTKQEYFDLVDLRINDIYMRPRCINCNGIIKFNQLSNGYSHHLYDSTNTIRFCSISCSTIYQSENNIGMNSMDSNIRKAYSQFINKGLESDECILYLAITNSGFLKFGITVNIDNRMIIEGMNNDSYLTYHVIKSGPRKYIAKLESDIKYKFEGKEYLEFSSLHKLIKIIKVLTNH